MNEVKVYKNDELNIKVRTILNADGSISINAEDTAVGFGWCKTEVKNGKEYTSIRWERMNGFSAEFGFDHKWGKDDYIPESLFYRLGMKASNATADKFQNWLAIDVIPSIRRNGGYIAGQETLTPEQIVANALVVAQNIINQKNMQIEEMTPKAEFFDAVASSKDAIEIGKVAKVLDIPGIGRNKLFEILRKKKVLMKNNIPYQKYIDCGYFRTIEQKYQTPDGETRISIKTLVYQKGVDYIRKIL